MRLLFLYSNREHAAPLLRSQEAMGQQGFEMVARYVADMALVPGELHQPHDALLFQEPPLPECVLQHDRPVVLLERIDGAQVRACRPYLDPGQIAGVIKGYVFRQRCYYNRWHDRGHVQLLAEAGIRARIPRASDDLPQPELSDDATTLITAGYGFGSYDCMRRYHETFVDFAAPRLIDVHFAGTVRYQESEIETHRRLAWKAADDWGKRHPCRAVCHSGRALKGEAYPLWMLRSKTVLSPWAWGEAAYRDYEAMLLGCVVIKPNTDYVESWPDIYRAGETYVACAPDFSDAHQRIAEIVDQLPDYLDMRRTAREIVLEAWRPEAIAQRMGGLLKVLLRITDE